MLTGYNTDVEHDGVVYHVQTEDKGVDNPFILSLVYSGGEILASKRSPYDDLIQSGFDERALSERLHRQHKLICAAIHAGRIAELKEMSQRESGRATGPLKPLPVAPAVAAPKLFLPPPIATESRPVTRISVSIPDAASDSLNVSLIDEPTLRSGKLVRLRMLVEKGSQDQKQPIRKARVVARILGSSFRPVKATATTGTDGIAEVTISIPEFKSGRAAMLVRAESENEFAELRRVIHPAK